MFGFRWTSPQGITATLGCLIALIAPVTVAAAPVTLTVFEWDGYIAPFAEDFSKFAKTQGMDVALTFLQKDGKEHVITSKDDIFQELRNNTVDIVTPTHNYYKDEGNKLLRFLAPIDLSKLSNYSDIAKGLRDSPYATLNGQQHAVPLLGGGYSLAYNVDRVKPAPTSWAALLDPRFKGRTSVVNAQYEANIFVAALLAGAKPADIWSLDRIDSAKVQPTLTAIATNAKVFWDDNPNIDLMAQDLDLITDYGFAVASANAKGQNWAFAQTTEPTTIWFDNISLAPRALETPDKAKAAHLLIDFMISPAIQARIALMYGVVVPNDKAVTAVPADQAGRIRSANTSFLQPDLLWQPLDRRTRNGYELMWSDALKASGHKK